MHHITPSVSLLVCFWFSCCLLVCCLRWSVVLVYCVLICCGSVLVDGVIVHFDYITIILSWIVSSRLEQISLLQSSAIRPQVSISRCAFYIIYNI